MRDTTLAEANRQLHICSACRYCEGYCPVFPEITQHRTYDAATVAHLAHLCHNCTACYHACQYKPPHEFAINIPALLTETRAESYTQHARPRWLAQCFKHNGVLTCLITTLFMGVGLTLGWVGLDQATLFGTHTEAGAFYQVVGHGTIVALASTTLLVSLASAGWSLASYWRTHASTSRSSWGAAIKAAMTLEHLGGGQGQGCNTESDKFSNARRWFHHCTMYGFLLCFAATCTASFYELVLGQLSPFPYLSLPVVLGSLGGAGLLIGTMGQTFVKYKSHPTPQVPDLLGLDYALLGLLFAISATGFLLLFYRETSSMGLLLIVHLALVLSFFVAIPFSKIMHAPYRFIALLHTTPKRP